MSLDCKAPNKGGILSTEVPFVDEVIMNALKEDMPGGDITTESIIPPEMESEASFLMKEDGIIAGLDICKRVFEIIDPDTKFEKYYEDGTFVNKGTVVAKVSGKTRCLLMGERTALNLLQRISGIATATYLLCEKVKDYPVRIVDTRKTSPGLRFIDKYAVLMGGGKNHRIGLSDGVLIKDNHIKAAGGIKNAVEKVRARIPHTMKIEVEASTLEQVAEALECGVEIIMLDNMNDETMAEAVKLINKRALVEASGNMTLDRVEKVASTGVDIISVGAITHSVRALDISMKIV